jgi:hypothetical protein
LVEKLFNDMRAEITCTTRRSDQEGSKEVEKQMRYR